MKTIKETIHVTVTHATSPTAHTFLYQLARGDVFGFDQPLFIHLMDFSEKVVRLCGIGLELECAAMPLVVGITTTKKFDEGFGESDYLVLMSPPVDYSEWPDPSSYIASHAYIFKDQAMALELFAKRSANVVVVGDLALTNAAIIAHFTSAFPAEDRVTCVTRLADTRVRSTLAARFLVTTNCVRGVVTWGCASIGAQYVDTRDARVKLDDVHEPQGIEKLLRDDKWLRQEFQELCDRGLAPPGIISTAQAVVDHMRDLYFGTPEGEVVGMGVATKGAYGVPAGLFCALPVTISNQRWTIVPRLSVTGCHQHNVRSAGTQLTNELEAALILLEVARVPSASPSISVVLEEEEEVSIGSIGFYDGSIGPPEVPEPSLKSESVKSEPKSPSIVSVEALPEEESPSPARESSSTSLQSVSIVEGFDLDDETSEYPKKQGGYPYR